MRYLTTIIAVFLTMGLTLPAQADSLFSPDDDDKHNIGLYGDHPVELEVGSIIKVRIREQSNAKIGLGVESSSDYNSEVGFSRDGNFLEDLLNPMFNLLGTGTVSHDAQKEQETEGDTDRTSRVDAIITALVVDVTEDGNLIIEGRKQINVNDENQVMCVRGMIDPRDISSDHIVESDHIADVEIEVIGEGKLSKRQKPGFLTRVIDFIL